MSGRLATFRAFGGTPPPIATPPNSAFGSSSSRASSLGRRQRDSDEGSSAERAAKRYELYAHQAALRWDVAAVKVVSFSKLDALEREIELYAQGLAVLKAKKVSEIVTTLRSADFYELIYKRVVACLCSPRLTAYHIDMLEHVMDLIRKEPDVFKVDPVAFEDPDLVEMLSSLVSKALCVGRSRMEQRLAAGIENDVPISQLAVKLATNSGIEITAEHLGRFAVLRKCLRVFNRMQKRKLVDNHAAAGPAPMELDPNINPVLQQPQPELVPIDPTLAVGQPIADDDAEDVPETEEDVVEWGQNDFWVFVDDTLRHFREDAQLRADEDDRDWREILDEEWQRCYQQDIMQYPAALPSRPAAEVNHYWQRHIEDNLVWD